MSSLIRTAACADEGGLRAYWLAVALLALVLTGMLALAGRLGGIGLGEAASGTRAIIVLDILALSILLWPSVAVSIRRLADRSTPGWGLTPMLFGALFVLMLAFFGKPFALGSVAALAPVATLMVIVLAAWLVVDTLVASRQRSMAAR